MFGPRLFECHCDCRLIRRVNRLAEQNSTCAIFNHHSRYVSGLLRVCVRVGSGRMAETVFTVVGATLNLHRTALDDDVVTRRHRLARSMDKSIDTEGKGTNGREGHYK